MTESHLNSEKMIHLFEINDIIYYNSYIVIKYLMLGVPLWAERQSLLTLLPDLDNASVGKRISQEIKSYSYGVRFFGAF